MEEDLNNTDINNSSYMKEAENEKSFVGKFKDIISNTPISKWFRKQSDSGSTIRRRDDTLEDEELYSLQPPAKRTKLPPESTYTTPLNSSATPIVTKSSLNAVTSVANKKVYTNSFPEPIAGPSGLNTRKLFNANISAVRKNSFRTSTKISELNGARASKDYSSKDYSGKEFTNNKDSDSEESTSGYSSVVRIGSKEQVCESQESSKQASPLESSPNKTRSLFQNSANISSRSLFTEHNLTPKMNSSMTSRRPSFNASPFSSPRGVNAADKSAMESTRRIVDSPFYSGRTIYGGASAYGSRHLNRSSQDLSASLRSTVKIKPVNSKPNDGGNMQLGKTAQRILDTLEQYSTPVNDAKKIPVASKKVRKEGMVTKYVGANPYLIRDVGKTASNKELQVPSVTDLLKMKKQNIQKSRLQDSTEAVRQLATQSSSTLNVETYKIPTENVQQEKHTGKIKTKITSVRQSKVDDQPAINDALVLNPVALPIKNLPTFDLGGSGLKLSSSANETLFKEKSVSSNLPSLPTLPEKKIEPIQPIQKPKPMFELKDSNSVKFPLPTVTVNKTNNGEKTMEFTFSPPIVLAENVKTIVAVNNFKFSEPLIKKRKGIHDIENNNNKIFVESSKTPKNNGESVLFNSFAKKDEQKSLVDQFKPAQGTWECGTCMIRNQPEKTKCAACETPKITTAPSKDPKPTIPATTLTSGFGDKFKAPSGAWECSICMIRNKPELSQCAACETPKPGAAANSTPKTATSSADKGKLGFGSVGFGAKFAAPAKSWECDACMVRNKEEATKCVACETPRPGASAPKPTMALTSSSTSFGTGFKIKSDEWECSTCMIRNKSTSVKCQCCETPKPGGGSGGEKPDIPGASTIDTNKPTLTFAFGIDKSTASSFTFGIPPNANGSTNAATAASNGVAPSSIFGNATAATSTSSAAPFSFGVPSKNTSDNADKSEKDGKSPAVTFSFGAPSKNSSDDKEKSEKDSKSTTSSFTFGAPAKSSSDKGDKVEEKKGEEEKKSVNPLLKPGEKLPEKAVSASAGFSFGLTAPAKPATSSTPTISTPITSATPPKSTVLSVTSSTTSASKPAALFTFGAKSVASSNATLPNVAVTTQANSNSVAKAVFTFGANSTNTPKFGETSAATATPTSTPVVPPTLGGFISSAAPSTPSKTPTNLFNAKPSNAVTFGTPSNTAQTSNNNSFGATLSNTPQSVGSNNKFGATLSNTPQSGSNAFGGTSNIPSGNTAFGASSNNNGGALFGAQPVGQQANNSFGVKPTTNVFGAAQPSNTAFGTNAQSGNTTLFGGATGGSNAIGATAQQVKPFSFGGNTSNVADANKAAAPAFQFGAAAQPTAASGGFGFGAAPASGGSTFNFGAASKPAPSFNSSTSQNAGNMFGSPAAAAAAAPQPAAQNGPGPMFNFGGGAPTVPKASFSFGASTAASGGQQSVSGGFNFGASAAATPAPGGFNFSAAAPPSFDANVKPSFNFSGGNNVTTFAAPPPTDSLQPVRKIKKAVRRTTPR